MLVANPGHTPYSFTATNKSSSNKNSSTSTTISTNLLNSKGSNSNDALTNSLTSSILLNQQKSSTSSTLAATAIASTSSFSDNKIRDKPSTSFDVIKTSSSSYKYNDVINSISVRINRGTELIKQTVNKALFSKIQPAFGGLLTVPPTSVHRSPDRNTKSTDSLKLEMCHFKPIKTVPTTPCKKTKIIIRTPKVKRAQKTNYNRYVPIKSAVSLLLSSQNSAFYLVKRSKDIRNIIVQPTTSNTTISTSILSKDNEKKLKGTDTISLSNKKSPITTNLKINNTYMRLKRSRNESPSSSTANTINTKRICLDNKTTRITRKSSTLTNSSNTNNITNNSIITATTSNSTKRANDDKPNGLIIENGQRRSIRIHNKKMKNDLNLNNTYKNNSNNNINNSNDNLKTLKSITNNRNSNVNLKTNTTLFSITTRNKSIFKEKKSEPIIEIKHSYRKIEKKSSPDESKINNQNDNHNNNNNNDNRNNESKNRKNNSNTKKKKQANNNNNNNNNKRKNDKSINTRTKKSKTKLLLEEKIKQKQIIMSSNDKKRTRQQQQQMKKSSLSSSSSSSTDKNISKNAVKTTVTARESVHNLRPRVQKQIFCNY